MRMLCLLIVAVVTLALPARASTITYNVTLAPEVVGATGSGSATVVYDNVVHSLSIDTTWSGLSGITTVAHIHCCVAVAGAGTVGVAVTPNTLPGFPVGVMSGAYIISLDLTNTATYTTGFLAGGTAASGEAALFAGMNAGTAYLNIHSNLFPAGEIRGFLAALPEPGLNVLLLGASLLVALRSAASRQR